MAFRKRQLGWLGWFLDLIGMTICVKSGLFEAFRMDIYIYIWRGVGGWTYAYAYITLEYSRGETEIARYNVDPSNQSTMSWWEDIPNSSHHIYYA